MLKKSVKSAFSYKKILEDIIKELELDSKATVTFKGEIAGNIDENDIKYMTHLRQSLCKNGKCRVCVETSEIHFAFEWKEILGVKSLDMNFLIKGNHYRYATNSEQNSYILSKIEELRSKGLDVSWFDKNKEKYLKTENEEETIFDL